MLLPEGLEAAGAKALRWDPRTGEGPLLLEWGKKGSEKVKGSVRCGDIVGH